MQTFIKINPKDNVAIVVHEMKAGSQLMDGVVTLSDVPQGHKVALRDIEKDGEIIRYGVVLG